MKDQHIYQKDMQDIATILIDGIENISFSLTIKPNDTQSVIMGLNNLTEKLRDYRQSLNNL